MKICVVYNGREVNEKSEEEEKRKERSEQRNPSI